MVICRCKVVATALVTAWVVGAGGVMLVRAALQPRTDGSAPRLGARPQDERPAEPRAEEGATRRSWWRTKETGSITWRGARVAGW